MNDKRWFLGTLVLAVALCTLIAAFNYVVDPWGLNYVVQHDGFNRGKPVPVQFERLSKAHAAVRTQPRVPCLVHRQLSKASL